MATTMTTAESQARRREKYHEADVVIVGAGPFGCTMAYALANQGRSVLLLERWLKEPDRIVGELLQPGGVQSLQKLGLGHCVEDIDAMPCHGYTVFYHGDQVMIPYPGVDEKGNVTHAWGGHSKGGNRPAGCAFHHGRFITKLRNSCLDHKNITVVETEVVKTLHGEHAEQILGVESRTTNKETGVKEPDYYFGQLTIIADGYDSKFRKQVLSTKPKVCSKFYALELIDCDLPSPGHGHVVIGNAFPILLYQIGTHETRALIDVPQGIPEASPENGGAINAALDQLYWRRKPLTGIINVLAQALYSLFAANDRQLRALQLGCFGYFKRGSTDGPVALLGGILQRPMILAYHFFSVAFLAIWLNACSVVGCGALGIFKAPLAIIDAVLILWKACIVFLPIMYRETFQ
ncbi:hypothetical protein ACJZ2D_010934 [Fusarium nematophilum]